MPEQAAERALRERLADDLPDDEPLRPAERLERPELAHALPDRGEGEQDRQQERGDRGEDRERDSRAGARGSRRSTSEPLIWSATCFALATCAFG